MSGDLTPEIIQAIEGLPPIRLADLEPSDWKRADEIIRVAGMPGTWSDAVANRLFIASIKVLYRRREIASVDMPARSTPAEVRAVAMAAAQASAVLAYYHRQLRDMPAGSFWT